MNPMTDDPGAQDAVVIERSLAAPREIVWQMWTNPEHFKVWYGPDGVTIPTARMDVRVELEEVGGRTRMVLTHSGIPADSPCAAGWARAFADSLIDLADVHVTLVDLRHVAGGHRLDAYPFVQLHQA